MGWWLFVFVPFWILLGIIGTLLFLAGLAAENWLTQRPYNPSIMGFTFHDLLKVGVACLLGPIATMLFAAQLWGLLGIVLRRTFTREFLNRKVFGE
jgi:hypothetical protein